MKVAGKVAIVTGAGGAGVGGLGSPTSGRSRRTARRSSCPTSMAKAAERTAAGLVADGGKAIGVRCDVSSDDDIDAMVAPRSRPFGRYRHPRQTTQASRAASERDVHTQREDWRYIMDVNTIAPVRCSAAVRPVMRARGADASSISTSNGSQMEAGVQPCRSMRSMPSPAFSRRSRGGQHPSQRHRSRHDDSEDAAGAVQSLLARQTFAARAGPKISWRTAVPVL